jgi:Tfp pilus assembly protein PilF
MELAKAYSAKLDDPTVALSEFELHRALREFQEGLNHAPNTLSVSVLWRLSASVRNRLGQNAEALDAARNAVHATPRDAHALHTLGVTLGQNGRHAEALARFLDARSLAGPELLPTVLCNQAAALAHLGRAEEAEDVLADAVHGPPPADAADYARMAITAAALELEEDALVLLARYIARVRDVPRGDVSALEFIDAAPVEIREWATRHPLLGRALVVVRQRERSPIPPAIGFRTHLELSPEGWSKLAALAGI